MNIYVYYIDIIFVYLVPRSKLSCINDQLNRTNSNNFCLSSEKDFSNRLVSISHILIFLMPFLLVLLL